MKPAGGAVKISMSDMSGSFISRSVGSAEDLKHTASSLERRFMINKDFILLMSCSSYTTSKQVSSYQSNAASAFLRIRCAFPGHFHTE